MSLTVGVVGLRRGGSFVPVFNHRSDSETTWVCDLNQERTRTFAEAHAVANWTDDYEELLAADVDAVVVATPAPLHAEMCISALEAGKHVLSEVPAVWTLDEARRLVAAVKQSGRKYMFAENMHYVAFLQSFDVKVTQGRVHPQLPEPDDRPR